MSTVIDMTAPQPDRAPRLVHQGLVYGSDEAFLAATVPFCLDGLQQDEAVLAVTTPANIDLLRQQLGSAAGAVHYIAADDWYQTPGSTLGAYYRYVDERTATGRHPQVRVIGEPVWHGRDALETDEWTRYEAVINLAFAHCPAWIVCPYDTRTVPDRIVADARRTHPQLVTGPAAETSGHYAPPEGTVWHRNLSPVPAPGSNATMRFGTDLHRVRSFVARHSAQLGMSPQGAERLMFAVNEVAANAVQHGGGHGEVSVWRTGHKVICEISDPGPTRFPADTGWTLGYLPPDPSRPRGHGLWTVRQLCDLVEVHTGGPATVVRVHLSLS
ncbi:sensor histidine kinase [Streptomyces sp. ISL-66]|uniref:sensor histidine kinase n=1 Tax=Streptomyces sp. ISL-66 TaxID=2819186 RepID=UPI001BE5405D|nr:sensor histidine kinase [Streptomyces sp. ISL-66]MBT2468993.1 sensor histidine kinase [Streptomyces sp. ISL-66]